MAMIAEHKIFEENLPLSQSKIWDLQKQHFQSQGIDAWTKGHVPSHVTNNPFIARKTALIALGFLRDYKNYSDPLYILEIGSGTGKFAYLFLKELTDLLKDHALKKVKFCYIMSDISKASLEFWKNHPNLKPYLEMGILDFALFDPQIQESLFLEHAKKEIKKGIHPLFVFMNYIYSGIQQDLFQENNGSLHEGIVTTYQEASSQLFPNFNQTYQFREAKNKPYYPDNLKNCILQSCQEHFKERSFYMPIGALQLIISLQKLSNGHLALFTSDKSFVTQQPRLSLHGSFSFPVNFYAINKYLSLIEGEGLSSKFPSEEFLTHLSLIGDNFSETKAAFLQEMNAFNPTAYCKLIPELEKSANTHSLQEILLYLNLSNFDPSLFHLYFEKIQKFCEEELEPYLRELLEETLIQIGKNIYITCREESFLLLNLGLLFNTLKSYEKAIPYFEKAFMAYDHNLLACYHKAISYAYLGNKAKALESLAPVHFINKELACMQEEFIEEFFKIISSTEP